MRFRKNIYKNGVMTLELSLLMPVILAVIILIIFTGYFYHDKCIIERGAYSACIKGAEHLSQQKGREHNEQEHTADAESMMREAFYNETDNRLTGKWTLSATVSNTDDEVSINVTGNMSCMNGIFTRYLSMAAFSVDINESAVIPDYGELYK
ncbi:MAG: TadE/TadG family type IV pilus assembly protein [Lachnospiraceae bacterium]|nr:TadE/TadG family type IV pilus assembly protein [Lachnospiraceae bacterium]